ncbi:rhodanese-like domain-containing protein [Granulicella cerasi]|uniref:Rhodanese-like domain-containing protein n=1 Tax=Granulicella cerasi TaxID=741063 RepID=A0ABW1ZAB9_9BACT|nr:rhodanese-like domain-containing protein [Granulicella cerasi]
MHLLDAIMHHGYVATAVILFVAACGVPLPLSLVLLTAGAAAHAGTLSFPTLVACAVIAGVCGDTLMYFGGRFTGWWLLAGLCRLSVNPETCIFGSARSFYKRGPRTLLFAKFVPGLATVAAPLAGSLYMRPSRFLRLDLLGVTFYVLTWTTLGYFFSHALRTLTAWVIGFGHVTAAMFTTLFVLYLLYLIIATLRDTRFTTVERVAAVELRQRLSLHKAHERVVVIADVRSHGYYDPKATRIKNSIRIEPNRLREELSALREFMAPECDIYLYCSCAHDATSVRVAKVLEQENCHTKVIRGGLRAWVKAGGEVEPVPHSEMEHLPRFE